ncbi:MAG TPA: hypothetical protein VJY15_23645 [Candidatus Acidoferrum sp.]|nr:hypothetical protein [Candidatus Acidoferrum sp.]
MSPKPKRRKCRYCSEFFFPDPHNLDRQRYCSKSACRHASKLASQQRWFRKPANRDYFRDPENARHVRQWRQTHPGYWKSKHPVLDRTQPVLPQDVNPVESSCNVPPLPRTLQDFALVENPGFVGLIAMITGRTLQDDIAATARRVIEQGRNILGLSLPEPSRPVGGRTTGLVYDLQTSAPSGSAAANPPKL